jgi:hypothetical protein
MGLGNDELKVREWVCSDMGRARVEGLGKEEDARGKMCRAIGANFFS